MNKCSIAVVGAGASGMMAALSAAEKGVSVVLFDGNEKAGKKLYATGNGKCNFTNLHAPGGEAAIARFRGLGMMSRTDEEGRCYPYSGQAASLVHILERSLQKNGVGLKSGDRIVSVKKIPEAFQLNSESGKMYKADCVIIATGGRAGLQFGSTGDGYGFARGFGHTLNAPRPGLVAIESEDAFLAELKGVRVPAAVTVLENGKVLASERGELQFTGTGVSGICVFNLSRYMEAPRPGGKKKKKPKAGEADTERNGGISEGKKYAITADLAPDLREEAVLQFLRDAFAALSDSGNLTIEAGEERTEDILSPAPEDTERCGETAAEARLTEVLSGIVNRQLAQVIAAQVQKWAAPEQQLQQAAEKIKSFSVTVSHTKGWDAAQVTVGGVRMEEIIPTTMESKKMPGLYFCGEVLDYDGPCGGYNLQWAWESGERAGKAAAAKVSGGTETSGEERCLE